jgi:hypothetical protein
MNDYEINLGGEDFKSHVEKAKGKINFDGDQEDGSLMEEIYKFEPTQSEVGHIASPRLLSSLCTMRVAHVDSESTQPDHSRGLQHLLGPSLACTGSETHQRSSIKIQSCSRGLQKDKYR